MNGADLSVGKGGPLRLRVPRQLGYKNVKFITRLEVTDDLKSSAKASAPPPPKAAMPGTPASETPKRKIALP
jgi:DMSO/TMAO reductase YedYZ molybdopterin-dependent catalytic subunit